MLKAPLDEYRWLCFLLDLFMPDEASLEAITDRITENSEAFGFISKIDIEEYQSKDIYDWLAGRGYQVDLVPGSYKHKDEIFPIFYMLIENGLLKMPTVPLWFDEKSKLYHGLPPENTDDIVRAEMGAFISIEKIVEGGVARKVGYYGSKFKMGKAKRVKPGEPNDDAVEAMGHAIHAVKEYDGGLMYRDAKFAEAQMNEQTIGDYRD